jgi:hypothetical protein
MNDRKTLMRLRQFIASRERENLAWLLRFAGLDLKSQPLGALVDLCWQSRRIAPLAQMIIHPDGASIPDYFAGSEAAIAELRQLQTEFRGGLEAIDAGEAWELAPASFAGAKKVQWWLKRSPDTGEITRYAKTGAMLAFILTAADLLVTYGLEIRRCQNPACRRFFLMEDPRQQYCTKECSDRVRQERHRPHRQRKHAVEYERRIAKKSPGARVTHRAPKTQRSK